jgi:hypothetical protein
VASLKPRRRRAPKRYVLKTLKPNRSRGSAVELIYGPEGLTSLLGEPEEWQEPVIHHVVDLTDHNVNRKVRKHCFAVHPSLYLECARDSKLDPVVQAAYQAARKNMRIIRDMRMHATRTMCEGKKSWNQILPTLRKFVSGEHHKDPGNCVHRIENRYAQWAISEISSCIARVFDCFGFTVDNLAACAKHKAVPLLSSMSSRDWNEHKRLIRDA